MEPRTSWDMLAQSRQRPACLSTGCPHLDLALGGGIRTGITELSGESASGKTQLVMQLLLQVQLPAEIGGLDGAALFLTSEGALHESRLSQMIAAMHRKHEWTRDYDFRDSIYVEQLTTLQDQHSVIFHRLPHLLRSPAGQHVRLIVLDSITALFRAGDSLQFDDSDAAVAAAVATASATCKPSSSAAIAALSSSTSPAVITSGRYLSQRAIEFFKLSAHLRRLSAEHNMPIVIVNQVTDLFEPDSSKNACNSSSSSSVAEFMRHQARRSSNILKLPALGLSWANCVNARIFLTRGSVSRPVPAHASSAQHARGGQNQRQQQVHQQAQPAQPQQCAPFELDAETEAAMHLLADAADAGGMGGSSIAEEAPAAIGATEPLREMHVIFSPLAPMRATRFIVTHDGVRGIPLD